MTTALAIDKRVALVIGESAYSHLPKLDNPKNDAELVADTLRLLGFKLVGDGAQLDLDKAGIDRVVQQFGVAMLGADVGLFYYAGHGVQVHGSNYLVPVDANPTREADVDFQMLDATLVLRQMADSGTKLNLVLLDACRNNPFGDRGFRAITSGLAEMQAPEGTLISFATQPGNVARDGAGGDSPYSKALAEVMRKPGLDVFRTFNEVGLAVASATGGQQQPWLSLSPIKGDFYFAGPPASATNGHDRKPDSGPTSCETQVDDKAGKQAVLAADVDAGVKACAQALEDQPNNPRLVELLQSAHEQQAFQRALRSNERGPSLAYLDLYPTGRFADDVKQYLASLTPAPESPPAGTIPSPSPSEPLSPVEPLKPKVDLVEVARVLQGELKRIGCDPGSIDGNWGASSQRALAQFNQQTHSSLDVNTASLGAIEAVRSKTERICPPTCGSGERLAGDQCVPLTCRHGLHPSRLGTCVADLPPHQRAASNARPRAAAEIPSPDKVRRRAAESAARSDCFTFNGERFCN